MNQNPQPPNPYGQSPYGAPPPPAPKKSWFSRHKFLTGLGGLVAVIVVISVATSGGNSGAGDPAPDAAGASAAAGNGSAADPSAKAPASALPGIGRPVRDGKFEFTVRAVRDGGTTVGPEFLQERAQGTYTLVDLTVRNTGDEAQSLDVSAQKLVTPSGSQLSADTGATISFNDGAIFYEQINPGNSLDVTIVYDVPAGTTPASIDLHDSVFSGGTTVSLR
ncbi:DUF4352 domain-containing protein [Williamsia phyllosphaerae]|uniref:DUF4352 domain-containing protein n=1 Tax=Williamsia phyllosphaerae TaxID=885042 RepID=A0ABQ1UT59_9NOCA|nr:DUF4352 domain-containing protein [Williamsia phyllosphaerae]GGF25616.1 hypothetical protein GCM10007298_21850 [Williamsia phyllosphaerae]